MATLTASGVICSDGTLNGQYTGTDSQATSLPLGAYVGALSGQANLPGRVDVNSSIPYVKYRTSNDYLRTSYAPSGTASVSGWGNLAGTWRSRGAQFAICTNQTYAFLAQRVA
jgi:hypothetical protein